MGKTMQTADGILPNRLITGQVVVRPATKDDEPRIVKRTSQRDAYGEPRYRLERITEYGRIRGKQLYSRDELAELGFVLTGGVQ